MERIVETIELSDGALDIVSGGESLLDDAALAWAVLKDGVKHDIHAIAQRVADATK